MLLFVLFVIEFNTFVPIVVSLPSPGCVSWSTFVYSKDVRSPSQAIAESMSSDYIMDISLDTKSINYLQGFSIAFSISFILSPHLLSMSTSCCLFNSSICY